MDMKLLALFSLALCVQGAPLPHTFSTFLPFHHQLNNQQYIQYADQLLHPISNQQYQQYYYQSPYVQPQLQLVDYQPIQHQVPLNYETQKPVTVLQYYTNPTVQYQNQPILYWQLNARNEILDDKEMTKQDEPETPKPAEETPSQSSPVIPDEQENEHKEVEEKEPVATAAPVDDHHEEAKPLQADEADHEIESIGTGVELTSNDSGEVDNTEK